MTKFFHDKLKSSTGAMLIEMLVAVFLVSLLMLSVVSSYLFVEKFLNRWKTTNSIYQEGQYITSMLMDDLAKCYKIVKPSPNTYGIILIDGDTVIYKADSLKILRNKRILNEPGIDILNLLIEKKSFSRITPDSILINGNVTFSENLALIRLELGAKDQVETLSCSVRMANENWVY
ncbi:hypothetical protein TRIP_C60014 [Candidatus Zixiibacteriota bacterium]|nr:hypothetical protein TRIP_C60014 [candidate division Zixibacteria bacterium]